MEAMQRVANALKRGDREIVLAGYAGTGKTTIALNLAFEGADLLAPTGKAAARLRDKTGMAVSTIHSKVCGAPVASWVTEEKKDALAFDVNVELPMLSDVVLVDEASMVGKQLRKMLFAKLGPESQVIWVGDPAQLPPVQDTACIDWAAPTGLLTEVLRQQGASPVLEYATLIRSGQEYKFNAWRGKPLVEPFAMRKAGNAAMAAWGWKAAREAGKTVTILCHTNKARININQSCRKVMGHFGKCPQVGEPLIMLTNHRNGMRNGETFTISTVQPVDTVEGVFEVTFSDGPDADPYYVVPEHMGILDKNRNVSLMTDWRAFWERRTGKRTPPGRALIMDYGYALTGHKSQGSEWDVVIHWNEWWKGDKPDRLLYTIVTRAREGYLQVIPKD